MFRNLKRRWRVAFAGLGIVYFGFYVLTTTVRLQGTGGLSCPLRVRVFKSERHLAAFYPIYLIERWVRNRSLFHASYYFNVEFEDGHYDHTWLYGDGKYSRIGYDLW